MSASYYTSYATSLALRAAGAPQLAPQHEPTIYLTTGITIYWNSEDGDKPWLGAWAGGQGGVMRVVVTGGRDYQDYDHVRNTLIRIAEKNGPLEIAHGCAPGADSLANEVAHAQGWPVKAFQAEWHLYGRSAGPMRNIRMLREFDPDLVVAFPGGKGTEHCVASASALGYPVFRVAAREADRG